MYDPENIQATSQLHADHSRGNRIIVHSLYGSGQLPHRVTLTSTIGSIHMLWRPVAHYTLGIRSRKPTSHFTTLWVHSRAKRIIVHPLYGSVKLPGSRSLTSPIGSVQIKGISVAAYAASVRSRKRASHFTTPCMGITHVQTALSYTRCKYAYSSLVAVAARHPYALYRLRLRSRNRKRHFSTPCMWITHV